MPLLAPQLVPAMVTPLTAAAAEKPAVPCRLMPPAWGMGIDTPPGHFSSRDIE
jgi:hypothetical protein